MLLPRGGVRGDRSSYGARGVIRVNRAAKKAALGWHVDGERHPGPQDGASLRGDAFERGSLAGPAWCVVSKPYTSVGYR